MYMKHIQKHFSFKVNIREKNKQTSLSLHSSIYFTLFAKKIKVFPFTRELSTDLESPWSHTTNLNSHKFVRETCSGFRDRTNSRQLLFIYLTFFANTYWKRIEKLCKILKLHTLAQRKQCIFTFCLVSHMNGEQGTTNFLNFSIVRISGTIFTIYLCRTPPIPFVASSEPLSNNNNRFASEHTFL